MRRLCLHGASAHAQEILEGHCVGDVVYSLINYSNAKYGSFAPGAKGMVIGHASEDRSTRLRVQFEVTGQKVNMLLTEISRDSDPNSVSFHTRRSCTGGG